MDTTPAEQNPTTAECPTCQILRTRLHDVEEAAERYLAVVNETGEARKRAADALATALVTDFGTAVLTSLDMTPEQRSHWLSECDKHEAASPPDAPEEGAP